MFLGFFDSIWLRLILPEIDGTNMLLTVAVMAMVWVVAINIISFRTIYCIL